MKIKKSHLKVFIEALAGSDELNLRDSRTRDGAIKKLAEAHEEFVADSKKVVLEFCEKGEDGEPNMQVRNGNTTYNFSKEELVKYQDETNLLNEEKISFVATDDIVAFVEDTNYKPKVGGAEIIYEVLGDMKKELKNHKAKAEKAKNKK